MSCSEESSKKNGWDYCTWAPDKLFGVYIGCCCKDHDKYYSKEGKVSKQDADNILRHCIRIKFIAAGKIKLGRLVSNIYFFAVMKFGYKFWKTWSSKYAKRYQ